MTWVRIDDSFYSHPKVVAAGNAAVGLWIRAASWSAQHLTDGFIPDDIARALGKSCSRVAVSNAGLWRATTGGYQITDWLDYNPSREKVLAQRKANAERVKRWRERQDGNGVTNSVRNGEVTPPPSRPLPKPRVLATTTTTSTGVPAVVAAVLNLYAEADLAARSVTRIRDRASYKRTVLANGLAVHADAISAHLDAHPEATPVDVAVHVLGLDRATALRAWRTLHPEAAS